MTNGTLTCAAINNAGTLKMRFGNIVVMGNVTNQGNFLLAGNAALNVGGVWVNQGLVDIIHWEGTLPVNFQNVGVVLDRSALRIEPIIRNADTVTIQMLGHAGHTYQLQRADLSLANWQDVGVSVEGTGSGGVGVGLEWVDGAGLAERFYRVKVGLEP